MSHFGHFGSLHTWPLGRRFDFRLKKLPHCDTRRALFTFTILVQVDGKDTTSVVSALSRQVKKLPIQLRKSLTWDRGGELASHKQFTVATGVQVYFCDPQSPWQRGSNENTNRLLRQYFPKGTDLSVYTQSDLDKVALLLNQRPRKTLSYTNPAEKLGSIAATTS